LTEENKRKENVRILVIDDEEIVLKSCKVVLEQKGFEVETRRSGIEGLNLLRDRPFDLVLCDLKMPAMNGITVLRHIRENHPDISVLIITGYATVSSAVEALKGGAVDYITKPFTPDGLVAAVESALERREDKAEKPESSPSVVYASPGVVGASPKMQEVFKMVEKVAKSSTTVLIRGESGTGKEVIARVIHATSLRSEFPFVAIDCGAIPENLVESELMGHVKGAFTGAETPKLGAFRTANGGTLFLDEIGNLSLSSQMKLLRVIEEKQVKPVGSDKSEKVDTRLIAATNCDLEKMVREGKFREDLFWRLSVFVINMPPLRERKEDIPLLVNHFVTKFAEETGKKVKRFTAEAMSAMICYDWPGNVRELGNAVLRAVHLAEGEVIGISDLPSKITGRSPEDTKIPRTSQELKQAKKEAREKSIEQIERMFVLDALERNSWNVTKAAEDVGMARQNFQAMMRKYGITSKGEENV